MADFKLTNQDFLNIPTSPPPALGGDPSMSLFNPSEQRYFSEFLDTLVVDQDFTFDPSSIPNLPNLPLFTAESMPGAFSLDSAYMLPSTPGAGLLNGGVMDFDMTSPSSQSSFGGAHSLSHHFGQGDSPVSPGSPSSTLAYNISTGIASNKRKTNKGASSSQDSSKLATPIHQLSKLSLNGNINGIANGNSSGNGNVNGHGNGNGNGPSNPKKNKRDEDEHPTASSSPSSPSRSREQKEDSRERNTSVSDGSVSDAATATTSNTATTKRKPYKELLTEEEKRANHIASEQKRRNTIRNGFKDMTDIIPDLKDVNSSKSTILFKAVDFIKHLERQNRVLQEKANRLESRLMNQRGDTNGSGLEDQRLQDIPHIYPVPCSR
ncbi:hypothetical protein BGZ99_004885 [Dissophora globulifera]|uniref:BHLH domain-containing protein n=1 Tax=Dissophora globulifera TaxID=979702 RepID=A0A9P6RIM0_9FUNG|nr:hypothetical protein BGZ99_004885 [Dissophora globulifera]